MGKGVEYTHLFSNSVFKEAKNWEYFIVTDQYLFELIFLLNF